MAPPAFTADPIVDAALTVFHSPGTYVALTGSGISRDVGIPTGDQVMNRLISLFAERNGADAGAEPLSWWSANVGTPVYGDVMKRLARTTAERQALLKPFFEPTPEERSRDLKMPSAAHRAIARLAREGFVRVIVTTNQERLHETALVDEGVVPSVIYHPDAIAGAEPLDKARCTVIKVSGDYLDTRLLNTVGELSEYGAPMKKLLRRVFNEYGVIVSGWSADWDAALRDIILGTSSRRYSWFWLVHTVASPLSQDLIGQRDARVVQGLSADALWTRLEQHVVDLGAQRAQNPVTPALAVARAKRLLREPTTNRVELRELMNELLDRVMDEIRKQAAQPLGLRDDPAADDALFQDRLRRLEVATEPILSIVSTVGTFGGGDQEASILAACLTRLASLPRTDGDPILVGLLRYPALLVLYAAAISMWAAQRLDELRDLLRITIRNADGQPETLWTQIYPTVVLRGSPAARLDMSINNWGSNLYLQRKLYAILRQWIPIESQFQETLTRFDALIGLLQWDGARGNRPHIGLFFFQIGTEGTTVEAFFGELLNDASPVARAFNVAGLLQSTAYVESNLLKNYRAWINDFRPRLFLGDWSAWIQLAGGS